MTRKMVVAAVVFVGGCNCNATEYNFPPVEDPPPVDDYVPTSMGSWLSFDVSPEGQRLTMSFYDRDWTGVGYAIGTPVDDVVVWKHEKVDGYPEGGGLDSRDVGKYSSQRTAPDGTVWIAYHDARAGGLVVAHRTGPGVWAEPETVDGGTSAPGVGHWASLELDGAGLPVIAHCDNAAGAVRVSRFDGSGWSTVQAYASKPVDVTDDEGVVTTLPAQVSHTDLAIDGNELVIAVHDATEGSLHLLRGSGDTFTDEVVDNDGDVGAWASLAVSGDEVWIAYQDEGREDLMFASREGEAPWTRERLDDGALRGADTALFAIDGEPAILYFDGMDNDQWIATRTDGSWTTEKRAGDEGAVGFHNEAVRVGGVWWTGSYDFTNNTLHLQSL